jgi:hypothetical protein
VGHADHNLYVRFVSILVIENSEPNFRKGSIPTSEAIRGKRRVELPLTLEEFTMDEAATRPHPEPWNKGKLVGQKAPFKLKEIWAIRVRLQSVS